MLDISVEVIDGLDLIGHLAAMSIFDDFLKILEIIDKADMNKVQFMSLIGATVDIWAGKQGLDSEETCEMLTELSKVQTRVHATLGPMKGDSE